MSDHDEALEVQRISDKEAREVHDEAMRRFDDTAVPQLEMRSHSLLARRFVSIPGAMWEGPFGDAWGEAIKLEVPKVKRGVQKIERDYRENRMMVDFRAASGDASEETAATLDGVYRADGYHFKSGQARDNAFGEAVRGGFGAYRLTNEWADPYDKDSDRQRINPAMTIVDADQSVFFDGNSKLYDKSDACFAFVVTAWTPAAFEAEYPGKAVDWPAGGRRWTFDWYQPDMVRVAEYYRVEDTDETLHVLTHPLMADVEDRILDSAIDADALRERKRAGWKDRTRKVKRRRVRKFILSGAEVLEDQGYIAGSCIPIVPVYGSREYVDNLERFQGFVSDRMDSQRNYNARVSKLAETDALAPREIPIFAAEQMPPNLAALWARQNIDRHPYALVEPLRGENGEVIAAGPIGKVEPPQLPPVTATLLQIAGADLDEDNQDGADQVRANTSADAMDIAAARVDAKSGIYLDNMRQSIQREGEIYLSMAQDIYFEKDREVDTLTEEGEDGTAVLGEEYTDPQTGRFGIRNDFSRGKYKVISDVTEATATQRDKTVRRSMEVAQAAGAIGDAQTGQIALMTALNNMEGEGSDVLRKYARQFLVSKGLIEPNAAEKAAMQAAQEGQQPDPLVQAQTAALAAQAGKDQSSAMLNEAKAGESKASTVLKIAQATQLGAPVEAPPVPDGLETAERLAKIDKDMAQAESFRSVPAFERDRQAA